MTEFASLASWLTATTVQIGPLRVRIASDVPDFPALRYFSRAAHRPDGNADLRLWCVSGVSVDLPSDVTTRAKGFESGYYATDHFGPPVRMSTNGIDIVLSGPDLQNVVWPYLVKFLLLRHTAASESIFLKAAAVEAHGRAALVIGRGGSGKSVMTTELCRRGAGFITNSHAIVTDHEVRGVASSIRMRPGPWVDRLSVRTSPALNPAEVVIDPLDAFGSLVENTDQLRTILVADYRGPDRHEITELSSAEALSIVEQFAFGLNVYRLEEDLLDAFGGDYREFAKLYEQMRTRLHALVLNCRAYHVTTDIQRTDNQDRMLELVNGGA